mgnify:CR=1 FL=1
MEKVLKDSRLLIFILFVLLTLPFNVEAKQTNTCISEYQFESESEFGRSEFISGDTIIIGGSTYYMPVEKQDFSLYSEDIITNFEYYIIDSIDSSGNIKYKKYDFTNSDRSVWYPKDSIFYDMSGRVYEYPLETAEFFNSCKKGRKNDHYLMELKPYYSGGCNVFLPAANGKITRWKFDSFKYSDKKKLDVCKYSSFIDTYYSLCGKTDSEFKSTYIGTYEYYTSYVYKFYEIPDEKPQLKVMCDNNKLTAGQTTKCKANISYKYGLSNILFNITSDKLKISNLQIEDYNLGNTWTSKEIDNGYSMNFVFDHLTNAFKYNPIIATFDVSSDSDVNNVLSSLKATNFRYVNKLGENTLSDVDLNFDLGDKNDNNENKDDMENISDKESKDNIINPSTFRDNYYLVIGILIVGLICFIQMKSKTKRKL